MSFSNNHQSVLRNLPSEFRTDSTQMAIDTRSEDIKLYRGLGCTVTPGMGVLEQLKAIDLNWSPEVSPIRYGDRFQFKTQSQNVLYRPSDGQFMGVVPKGWYDANQSFASILDTFNTFCSESGLSLERVGKIEKYTQGEDRQLVLKLFAIANLNEQFQLAGDDIVTGKLLLVAPYLYGQGYQVKLMSIRHVCTNGLNMPVKIGSKVINHIGMTTGKIQRVLEASKMGFVQHKKQAELLSETPLTKEEAMMMLIAQFGFPKKSIDEQPRVVRTCLKMFERGSFIGGDLLSSFNTAWGLLQTVTEYYNHRLVSVNPNKQIDSLWLGRKSQHQLSFLESISGFATEARNGSTQTQSVGIYQ
jgi:hypothetical protein